MNCPECSQPYSPISNLPKIVCANKHVVCQICSLSPKSSVCSRCSQPLLSPPYTCHNTLAMIKEPVKYTLTSLLVIVGVLGYLYSTEGYVKEGLLNFKYYFVVTATDFLVKQVLLILFEVLPVMLYLRKNPEKNKVGVDYLAEVALRQVLLWNARRLNIVRGLLMLARYVSYWYNLKYVTGHYPELGAIGILSTIVTAFSLSELPLIKSIISAIVRLVVMLITLLSKLLNRISNLLCTLFIFTIYFCLAALGFFGYMFQADMFRLRGKTLDLEPLLFALPYLIHRQYQKRNPQENNWLTIAFYHNFALWMMRYVRYSLLTDVVIAFVCVPKLMLLPVKIVMTLGTGESFDNYHDLGTDVCAGLSALLTPLQVTLFVLMPYVNI